MLLVWLLEYQGAEITCKEIRSPLEEQPLLVTGFLEFASAGTALDGSNVLMTAVYTSNNVEAGPAAE